MEQAMSGLAAKHLWVLLNPRYLVKAMQDHQALKTIWTKIMNMLRTEFYKAKNQQLNNSRPLATRRKIRSLMLDSVEATALAQARLDSNHAANVAQTLSWFYSNESD